MRMNSVRIENFRAIVNVQIDNLSNAVVIAGPNGCGKSSIFDAIRLVKSAYGQYRTGEYSHWYSEFQISPEKVSSEAKRILNDPNKPLKIEIEFEICDDEQNYLKENANDIFTSLKWSDLSRQRSIDGDIQIRDPRTKLSDSKIVNSQALDLANTLIAALKKKTHVASLNMKPGETPSIVGEPVLELMFSLYRPEHLGIIDYHSSTRNYARERVQNLNLKIEDASESKAAQSALYNTQNKYTGIKTEMAQSYVKELLAEKAGIPIYKQNTLKSTLDELFATFFPGKKFLGVIPTPDGRLEFPVELEGGKRHDINELSSGEKEVLLGYLRLRNSAPRNSIILLDEPELHLNPRLARGLPRFYQKHLGEALGNQIWLVTHSDAILREAVQEPSYCVYHMQPQINAFETKNQIDRVDATAEVESAIISLVGDLATYSPRSKIVLLEGDESEVDVRIITELFPELAAQVNLISMGNKSNVKNAHQVLETASISGGIDARFYSIVDRDFDGVEIVSEPNRYSWDVYHIENFLMEPSFISEAMKSLTMGDVCLSEADVLKELKTAAEKTIDELVKIKLERRVNKLLIGSISYGYDSKVGTAKGMFEATQRSFEKISTAIATQLTEDNIKILDNEIRDELASTLSDDRWRKEFRGRNIIRRFAGKYGQSYESLRNLIVNRMREKHHQPENMLGVIQQIVES